MTVAVPEPLGTPSWSQPESVQMILDAIEAVIDAAKQLVKALNDFTPTFYEICKGIMIASVGLAWPLVSGCIGAFEGLKRLLVPMLQGVYDFVVNLRAPAGMVALGDYLIGTPTQTMGELHRCVQLPALATFHWQGAGADAYRKVAKAHEDAFKNLHDVFKPTGQSVRDFGVAAQNTAIKATCEIGAGLIALIVGIAALTPPVTVAGAIVSGASAAFIGVVIKTAGETITSQNTAFNSFVQRQMAIYSVWPRGGGGTATEEAAMGDGSVQDDARDNTAPEWGRV